MNIDTTCQKDKDDSNLSPKEIVRQLDRFVVGQKLAKHNGMQIMYVGMKSIIHILNHQIHTMCL